MVHEQYAPILRVGGKGIINDPRNTLLLRSDVHILFDAKRFVIALKQGKWTTHVLQGAPQDELARNFHSIQMQPITDIAIEFLFARFVYAIHSLGGFTRKERSLLQCQNRVENGLRLRVGSTKASLRHDRGHGRR